MKWRLEYVQPPGGDNLCKVAMERKSCTIEADSFPQALRQANMFLEGRKMIGFTQLCLPQPLRLVQ